MLLPPQADPVPGCTVALDSPAEGSEITAAPTFRWTTGCTGAYVEVSSSPQFPVEETFTFGAVGNGRYTVPSTLWGSIDQRFAAGGWWRATAGAAEGAVSTEAWAFTIP